jgi:hypothetical protein
MNFVTNNCRNGRDVRYRYGCTGQCSGNANPVIDKRGVSEKLKRLSFCMVTEFLKSGSGECDRDCSKVNNMMCYGESD